MTTIIKQGGVGNNMRAASYAVPNSTDIVEVTKSGRSRNSVSWEQFTSKFSRAMRKIANSPDKGQHPQVHQVAPKSPAFQRIMASLQNRKQKKKASKEVLDANLAFQVSGSSPLVPPLLLKEDPLQKIQRYTSAMSKVPDEKTLIKYVGDALIAPLEQEQEQEEHYTVETELFFKLVQASKWEMAQTIAQKIRRRMLQVTTDCQEIDCFLDECADS